jgi:predicted GIY-YIG superfamily endonuclease
MCRTGGYVVYRILNASGDVIYVGCTGDLNARMAHHRVQSPWWSEASEIHTGLPILDRRDALAAELALIKTLRPKHNVTGLVFSGGRGSCSFSRYCRADATHEWVAASGRHRRVCRDHLPTDPDNVQSLLPLSQVVA